MILVIDNYDSFTYNLVHLIASEGNDYKVIRNDVLSMSEIHALKPSKILISPDQEDLKMQELLKM